MDFYVVDKFFEIVRLFYVKLDDMVVVGLVEGVVKVMNVFDMFLWG